MDGIRKNYCSTASIRPFFTGESVSVLSDGYHVISTCDSSVKIVDLNDLSISQSFDEEEDTPLSLVVSPDETVLVVSWRSSLIKQYDWRNDKCTKQWKGHNGPVVAMAIDPTSTLLATGSTDSTIKVWDIVKQFCTHNFRPGVGVVSLVKYHPSRLLLFSSSTDYTIRVWDLETSKCIHVLTNHVSPVTCLGFISDGQSLVSGGRDQIISYWNLESAELVKTLPTYEAIEGLVVLPSEGRGLVTIATVGSKGVMKQWDIERGQCISSLETLPENLMFTDLQHVQDKLVGVVSDQSLIVHSLKEESTKHYIGYLDEVLDIKCVGGDANLVAVATNSENLKIYDVSNWSCDVITGHSDIILCIDTVDDIIVTGSKDNTIRIWKLDPSNNTFSCYGSGRGHTMSVTAVACSKVRSSFVVSGSEDKTMKLWSLTDMDISVVYTVLAHDKDINSIDVSPNDKLIVTGSHDKTAKIWSVSNGDLIGTLRGHKRGVWSVQFSPVDQVVLTGSTDTTIKLWSVANMNCLKTFEDHTHSILKAIFITKGSQIASVGSDGVMKLWDIKANECVNTIDSHEDKIWSLTSASDGDILYTGGVDSTLHQWKDVTEEVKTEEREKRNEFILKEQQLMNLIQSKDYITAVGVAISLDQPNRVYNILAELVEDNVTDEKLYETIKSLDEAQIGSLLHYIKQWNTNSKYCLVAQLVLNIILKTTPTSVKSLKELISYTERHFERVTKLYQLTSFLEIVK